MTSVRPSAIHPSVRVRVLFLPLAIHHLTMNDVSLEQRHGFVDPRRKGILIESCDVIIEMIYKSGVPLIDLYNTGSRIQWHPLSQRKWQTISIPNT